MESLISDIISAREEAVDGATERLIATLSRESGVDAVVPLVPRLLLDLTERALGPPGDPSKDVGDTPIRLWECLKIVGCIKDIALHFPALCETHFYVLYGEVLPRLAKRDAPLHNIPWGLLIADLLTMWSPKIGSPPTQCEVAFPVIVDFMGKENEGIKYAATTVLETLAAHQPALAEKWTKKMLESLKTGFVVSVPVLSCLYSKAPAGGLFEKHVKWLLQLFETDKASKPLLATLFRNMAEKNPLSLESSILPLWMGLSDAATVVDISFAMASVARANPNLFLGRLEDAIRVPKMFPEASCGSIHLLAAIGSASQQVADVVTTHIVHMLITPSERKDHSAIQVAALDQMMWLDEKRPGILHKHAITVQSLVMSQSADVREIAYRACAKLAGSQTILRVPRGQKASDTTRHNVFGTFVVKDSRPWKDYFEVSKPLRERTMMPIVLMVMRFDGSFGFPGGSVEDGETLMQALGRELREEINFDGKLEGFEHVAAHQEVANEIRSHFFAKSITEEEMREIEERTSRAPHYGAEIMGTVRVPLLNLGGGRGLEFFLRNRFVGASLQELLTLLQEWDLIAPEFVVECMQGIGINH